MSTLERIRKRPGLVISVLGIALVLFIITGVVSINDIMNITNDRTTVAKVNGKKLSMQDFNAEQNNFTNGTNDSKNQDAFNNLINKALIEEYAEKAGFKVTDEEMQEILFNPAYNGVALAYMQYKGIPFASVEEFHKVASAQNAPANIVGAWMEMENDIRDRYLSAKYGMTYAGLIKANKLDAQASYDDNMTFNHVTYAFKGAGAVDEEVTVSASEIDSRYNDDKELYAVDTETRLVNYMLVVPRPSDDDIQQAGIEADEALAALRTLPGTEGVADNYEYMVEQVTGRASAISDFQIRNQIPNMENNGAVIIDRGRGSNRVVLAKLIGTEVAPDSVTIDIAVINPDSNAEEVVASLNAGTDIADITGEGKDILGVDKDIKTPLADTRFAAIRNEARNATVGEYFIPEYSDSWLQAYAGQTSNGQATLAIRVNYINEPVEIYDIAKITREIKPSTTTKDEMEAYIKEYAKANSSASKFRTGDSKYPVKSIHIDGSTLNFVNDVDNTARISAWAMDAKEGDFSEIFTDGQKTYMIMAVVEGVYKDYIPAEDAIVAKEIQDKLVKQKKADILAKRYAGKADSVEGYAELMGTNPEETSITYGSRDLDMIARANIAAAAEGKLVGPIATDDGVIVFTVTERTNEGRELDAKTDGDAFARDHLSRAKNGLINALRSAGDIEYSVLRFHKQQ